MKTTIGTYNIWRAKHPLDRPNMNPTKLSNQRRIIEKSLTESEKETIRRKFQEDENLTPNPDIMEGGGGETETPENSAELEVAGDELDTDELKMKDDLTVMYAKVKNEELDQRVRPKKFPMTKENRYKLKSMNKVLTAFIGEENDI